MTNPISTEPSGTTTPRPPHFDVELFLRILTISGALIAITAAPVWAWRRWTERTDEGSPANWVVFELSVALIGSTSTYLLL